MIHLNRQILLLIWMLIVALAGCKKDRIRDAGADPDPEPGEKTGTLSFNIASLPGSAAPQYDLYALVTIVNKQNQEILSHKRLALSYDHSYQSASVVLPAGDYRLSKLLVFNNANVIFYAAPIAGSVKSAGFDRPLALDFKITRNAVIPVAVAVAAVGNGDTPGMFGYPDDAFIPKSNDPGSLKIRIRTALTIGKVVYDSIPSTLTLTSWDRQNQPRMSIISLPPGVNEITLDRTSTRFRFKVSRWNMTDELTLQPSEIEEGKVYNIGGSRPARKLIAVNTARVINAAYKADTRQTYHYRADGLLERIEHYLKDENYETKLSLTEVISHNAQNKVSNITRTKPGGEIQSSDVFEYRANGWLDKITRTEKEGITTANTYFRSEDEDGGITNHYVADLIYTFTHRYYTEYNHMQFYGGNILTDVVSTSHGNAITGWYEYDFNINPYFHLDLPDLYFENSWRHNRINQMRQYTNVFPQRIPYDIKYTYDSEGYPIDVFIKYRSYLTGEFLYQTKSVFYYQ